jgi:LCP family protein required for cell wall assembly
MTPKITVLELPRDLWVEIPEIADNINQDHEKLNQAYLYGNPGFHYYDHPSAGPGLLARTLDLNFGVRPDHYGAVNMRTFEKIVNAVGGIDVTLPETVDGRAGNDTNKRLVFMAGTHHLNGGQALTLARIRVEGTFERADNQNIVLCALRDKLTQPEVVKKIPDLIASFQDNIQTDLSLEQLGQLACLGTQLRPENILFASFPEELFKPARIYDPVFKKYVFVWDVDFNVLRLYIARFNGGSWPAPSLELEEEEPAFVCP